GLRKCERRLAYGTPDCLCPVGPATRSGAAPGWLASRKHPAVANSSMSCVQARVPCRLAHTPTAAAQDLPRSSPEAPSGGPASAELFLGGTEKSYIPAIVASRLRALRERS